MRAGLDLLDDLGDDDLQPKNNDPSERLNIGMNSMSISSNEAITTQVSARRALEVSEPTQRRMEFNRPEFPHRRSNDGRSFDCNRGHETPSRGSFESGRRSSDSHSRRSLDPSDFPDYASYLAARVCTIKRSMDPSISGGQDVLDEIYEVQDLEFEEEAIDDVDPEEFADFGAFRERYNAMLERAKYNHEMGKSNIHLQ